MIIFGDWNDPKSPGYDREQNYPDVYTAQDQPCREFLADLLRLYQKHGLMLRAMTNETDESGNKQPMLIQSFDPNNPVFGDDLQDTLQAKLFWRHDPDDPDLEWRKIQIESFDGFQYIFWAELPPGITIEGYRPMNPDQVRMIEDELFKQQAIAEANEAQRPEITTYPDCATANETATA